MTVNCVMLLVEKGWVNTRCVNIFICYLVTFLLVCIPFLRCLLYSEKHIGVSPYRTSKWHTTQKSFSNVILLQGVVLLKFLFITRTAPYIIFTDNILFNFCKKNVSSEENYHRILCCFNYYYSYTKWISNEIIHFSRSIIIYSDRIQ